MLIHCSQAGHQRGVSIPIQPQAVRRSKSRRREWSSDRRTWKRRKRRSSDFEQWVKDQFEQCQSNMARAGTGFWSQAEDAKKKLEEEANKTEQDWGLCRTLVVPSSWFSSLHTKKRKDFPGCKLTSFLWTALEGGGCWEKGGGHRSSGWGAQAGWGDEEGHTRLPQKPVLTPALCHFLHRTRRTNQHRRRRKSRWDYCF